MPFIDPPTGISEEALHDLGHLLGEGTPAENAAVQAAIDLILQSNEAMAQNALDEAILGGGNQGDIDDTGEAMEEVYEEWAEQDYDDASEEFYDAWEEAYDAGGTAQGTLPWGAGGGIGGSGGVTVSAQLTLTGTTFSDNQYGIRVAADQPFSAQNCQFTGHSQWGVYLEGDGTLDGGTIDTSAAGGLWLKDATSVDLATTTFTDNGPYAIYIEDSTLAFTVTNVDPSLISGQDHVFAGSNTAIHLSPLVAVVDQQRAQRIAITRQRPITPRAE